MIESSCIFPAKMPIERVIELPNGGAVNHPWSPGAKYEPNSTQIPSGKAQNLRRKLLGLPGSNSGPKLPRNPSYQKPVTSVNDNQPKFGKGKGIRVRSFATTDENGEPKTIYYNQDGQEIPGPEESQVLNDLDLGKDK